MCQGLACFSVVSSGSIGDPLFSWDWDFNGETDQQTFLRDTVCHDGFTLSSTHWVGVEIVDESDAKLKIAQVLRLAISVTGIIENHRVETSLHA